MLNAYFVETVEEIIKQNNYLSNAHTAQWEYCPSSIFMLPIAENEVEYNWITVQEDATYSVYYISVGSSTFFGCSHPSSGAPTTVIAASGID